MQDPESSELPFYGLYKVKEENGFSSYNVIDEIDDLVADAKAMADVVRTSLEKDSLVKIV